MTIFKDLKKTHTLVVVEHDMAFVREIADVVTVMHMGSLLAQGPIGEIEANARFATSTSAMRKYDHAARLRPTSPPITARRRS